MYPEALRTHLQRLGALALLLFLVGPLAPGRVIAQEVDIYGFVKSEYIHDTRQVVQIREGEFMLAPLPESDATDVNNLEAFAFFSRVGFTIGEMPPAFGADLSGTIEADFFGATEGQLSAFRLRRAFVQLAWENREVLFGQEFTPVFLIQVFPPVIGTEAGTPFNAFARHPQIRLTLKPQRARVIGVLSWHRDAFASRTLPAPGDPGGVPVTRLQQQASLPGAHLHGQLLLGDTGSLIGAGAYYKWLRPTPTADRFGSGALVGYAKLVNPLLQFSGKVTFGEDLVDHLVPGGYVQTVDGDFEPLQTLGAWVDVTTTTPISLGLFAGYYDNFGASDDVDVALVDVDGNGDTAPVPAVGGFLSNLDYLWRVSPRLVLNNGPLRLALEVQITSALYADARDADFAPDASDDVDAVTNVRTNFSVFLFF